MYQRIMDDVIENCQTTFEEDAVNQQTLDDLRKVSPSPSLFTSAPSGTVKIYCFDHRLEKSLESSVS